MRGKENVLFCTLPGVQDHPRLCGEKALWSMAIFAYKGSPPPMRGKGEEIELYAEILRITPAYAGKSQIRLGLTS